MTGSVPPHGAARDTPGFAQAFSGVREWARAHTPLGLRSQGGAGCWFSSRVGRAACRRASGDRVTSCIMSTTSFASCSVTCSRSSTFALACPGPEAAHVGEITRRNERDRRTRQTGGSPKLVAEWASVTRDPLPRQRCWGLRGAQLKHRPRSAEAVGSTAAPHRRSRGRNARSDTPRERLRRASGRKHERTGESFAPPMAFTAGGEG